MVPNTMDFIIYSLIFNCWLIRLRTARLGIAVGFARALRREIASDNDIPIISGFESVISNDLLITGEWETSKCWSWKRKSHINVLESFSSVCALADSPYECPDSRLCLGVDSQVAKGALSKGRSSARSLQPMTKRSCSIQICFGTFPVWFFAPTRLNLADDPTRDAPLRKPSGVSFLKHLDATLLSDLHFVGLRRFAANWVRLFILVQLPSITTAAPFDVEAVETRFWTFDCKCLRAGYGFGFGFGFGQLSECCPWISNHIPLGSSFAFEADYGLGIGFGQLRASLLQACLCLFVLACFVSLLWIFLSGTLRLRWICASMSLCASSCQKSQFSNLIAFSLVGFHSCEAMEPLTAAERERALARSFFLLPADRVVRKETRQKRNKLILEFRCWLWKVHQISLRSLLDERPPDAERISHWLVQYGRAMFSNGKSYGRFSETINGIAMMKPLLKKQLTPAWDLAFSWITEEPHEHHPALPVAILLGMMTVALHWGWPIEAALFSLMWAGILRVGEVLKARRCDLILPSDVAPGSNHLLLRIVDPKTRGRAARHQSARVDQCDIIALLTSVFGRYDSHEPLWQLSASTLRLRFIQLLKALDLPVTKTAAGRPYDLASLRPGGATWTLGVTENSELVRRRGRWLSNRVMEIYLQEVESVTYIHKLTVAQRQKISDLAFAFPQTLEKAICFLDSGVPPRSWFALMKSQQVGSLGKDGRATHFAGS